MERAVIAFMPCFNESASVAETVRRTLAAGVRYVIVTNDGSRDNSLDILRAVSDETGRVFVLNLRENRGVAVAKLSGFSLAYVLWRQLAIPRDALLAKLDSDGQHDPAYIPRMVTELERRGLDFLLSCRDFSNYPMFKIAGNCAVSAFASVLAGRWLRDSMSGLKIMTMPALETILSYFTGYRYAAAQEITMIPCMKGLRFANDFRVDIPIYRSGSGWRDGYSVLKMSLVSFGRVRFGRPLDPGERSRRCLADPNLEIVRAPIPVRIGV